MKNPISISNFRRPLRLILLLSILLIASNLFISSISQFYIVNREIDNIGGYYKSIGTIISTDYIYIGEARDMIASDEMIAFENGIRTTIGRIDGLYSSKRHSVRGYIGGSNYNNYIFTARIKEAGKARSADNIYQGTILVVNVDEILAGIPDIIEGDSTFNYGREHHMGFLSHSLITGEKFEYINDDVIDELFQLEAGKKYMFRIFREEDLLEGNIVKPLYEGGPLYIELDDYKEIDWNTNEFKIIKDEIDFINENIIAYELIGIKDMTVIPEVQDSMKDYYLVDGRWIDEEDHREQNNVIVINKNLAKMYDIDVGDALEVQMRDSEYGFMLYSGKDQREWRNYPLSEPQIFEVVGIYGSNVYSGGALSKRIYVPDSMIPEEFGGYTRAEDELKPVYSHLYSFVLKSVEDESIFVEKYKEILEGRGFELRFVPNNAEGFLESSKPIKRSISINLGAFSVLLMLVQGFIVYIYTDGHKLNYAIERALGFPSKISGRHLTLPMIIFSGIATTIGGYIGYSNAVKKSIEILSDLSEKVEGSVNSELNIKYLIIFVILAMIPFMIMLMSRSRQLKNASVIDLINNNKKQKIKKRLKIERENYGDNESIKPKISISKLSNYLRTEEKISIEDRKKVLSRYSINNAIRSKITSILLISLAGLFVFSLLWMNYLSLKNEDLIEKAYNEIIITGDILIEADGGASSKVKAGPINKRHIDNLLGMDLLKDHTGLARANYLELFVDRNGVIKKYEIGEKDQVHFYSHTPTFTVYASNKRFNSEELNYTVNDLKFMEGYSLDDFYKEYRADYSDKLNPKIVKENGEEGFPVLVSSPAMEHFDLKLGDKIFLEPNKIYRKLSMGAYGTIVGTFKDMIKNDLNKYGDIGYEFEQYIYPMNAFEAIEWEVYYDGLEFEFKPEKNRELMERKDEIRKIVSSNPFNEYPTELRIWDGELTNVVEPLEKNISLLEVLYPITFILSIVIASILAFMMVIRRSTDVAILRILGVKSREVQWNLFRENIILVLIGIIASCITIFIISSNSYPIDLTKYAMVCGGYLLGTIVGLILGIAKVTNKKPLEMLQVKE